MRGKRIAVMLVVVLTGILMLAACGGKQAADKDKKETKTEGESQKDDQKEEKTQKDTSGGEVFGNFHTKSLEGEEVTQDVFAQADLTLVNIWGTFCGPCIREMPELGEISREYAGKGLQIIGLISDVNEAQDATAKEIIEKTQADYLHIIASEDLARGILSKVNVVPTTIFVDKEGKQVGEVVLGAKSKDQWIQIIKGLQGSL